MDPNWVLMVLMPHRVTVFAFLVGSAHGQDMIYIFQSTSVVDPIGGPLNWSLSDLYVTEYLTRTTANFVKSG